MPNSYKRLSPDEVRRIQSAENTIKELKKVLNSNYHYIITLQQVQKAIKEGNDSFSVLNNKVVLRKINKILKQNTAKFNVILLNAIQKEWELTNPNLWKGLKMAYSKTLKETKYFNELRLKSTANLNNAATDSRNFYNEVRNGIKLSERVWNFHQNIPKEMDVLIQNSIKQGKSADQLSRNLNRYLKEPDKIFRKVRNKKTGKLEWSKAAKQYNPGRGVYRSSYKNAMRLARTEINRAYRYSEWLGYQKNNLIYGYEIVLSNNTENQCSVCKRLAGVYPKWFLWTGWHPQCRCRMVPVLMPKTDWQRLLKYRFEGRENEFKPNIIEELPNHFIDYLKENEGRVKKATVLPYWYQDNLERLNTILRK